MFNIKFVGVFSRVLLGGATLLLTACGTDYLNQEQYSKVEKVAVVIYSVPELIASDDRDATDINTNKKQEINLLSLAGSLLGSTVKKATDFIDPESSLQKQIVGTEAANVALPQFISEMRKLNGWIMLNPKQVSENASYQQLSMQLMRDADIEQEKSMSRRANGPSNYLTLGLPYNHTSDVDYYENAAFKQWVKETTQALHVDALIVMNDTGFATDQKSLFFGGRCFTKSAFHFAMFDYKGEKIVDTRSSFEESKIITNSLCANGAFYKSDYINALKQHGKDQAIVITAKLNELKK